MKHRHTCGSRPWIGCRACQSDLVAALKRVADAARAFRREPS